MTAGLPPLGLYLHLPWCARKCPYCDFNSHQAGELPEQAYVDALLRDLAADLPLAGGRRFATVFFGGGTPSLFQAHSIQRLLDTLRERALLEDDAEITLEANPGSVEQQRFLGYFAAGVNRISIGVQSFDGRMLQLLGRIHDASEARAAFHVARDAGFERINIDLMHGLPHQSADGALDDLGVAIDLAPEHISWYQLTIEPNTAFWSAPPPLPAETILGDIESRGAGLLARHGYQHYEVSAWARPGEACRHNLNYWTFGDYLGIGAGAHGKLTLDDGRVLRTRKTRVPDDYLGCDFAARRLQEVIAPAELAAEFLLNYFRLGVPLEPSLFSARTGLASTVLDEGVTAARARGLLETDRIQPSALGMRYLNDLLALF